MGVYKYDAINDELIPIAGVPSVPGIEDKVSTYTADATYWDTSPTAASTKPVISDGIKTQFDLVHNELSDVNNILGSKNNLPNSATTQVINGITYTVAADGSINVNGTASADSILHIVPGTTGKLSNIFSKGGNYIISVGTTGTGVNVFFGIEYTGSTWDIAEWLTYSTRLSKEIYIDGTKLNNSSSYIESYIKVNSGTTVSNIKVYPMLRPSSVRDDTYVPYSKTNYELTTEISNLANKLAIINRQSVLMIHFHEQSGWTVGGTTSLFTSRPTLTSGTILGERNLTSAEVSAINHDMIWGYNVIYLQSTDGNLTALRGKTVYLSFTPS